MPIEALLKLMLAAMFSPPGVAAFIIATIMKKRLHATAAALLAASAFVFMNEAIFRALPTGNYILGLIFLVIGMMISCHIGFTIGEKVIRSGKKNS